MVIPREPHLMWLAKMGEFQVGFFLSQKRTRMRFFELSEIQILSLLVHISPSSKKPEALPQALVVFYCLLQHRVRAKVTVETVGLLYQGYCTLA